MVEFYKSCGSPAELITQWELQFVGFVLTLKGGSFKGLIPTTMPKEWLISIHEQERLHLLWHTERGQVSSLFLCLFSWFMVKNVLKSIKNVLKNINEFSTCLWKSMLKLWKNTLWMCLDLVIYVLKILLDLVIFACKLSRTRQNVKTPDINSHAPRISNPHRSLHKITQTHINTLTYLTKTAQHLTILSVINGANLCQLRINKRRSSVIGSLWIYQFSVTSTHTRLTGKSYSNWNPQKSVKHTWKT